MPEDAPVEAFQKMLESLKQSLGRSDSKFTAVSIDKHYAQDLIDAGDSAIEAYWALSTETQNAQERAGLLQDDLEDRFLVDPKIIS